MYFPYHKTLCIITFYGRVWNNYLWINGFGCIPWRYATPLAHCKTQLIAWPALYLGKGRQWRTVGAIIELIKKHKYKSNDALKCHTARVLQSRQVDLLSTRCKQKHKCDDFLTIIERATLCIFHYQTNRLACTRSI
jgi:hypothetical protein